MNIKRRTLCKTPLLLLPLIASPAYAWKPSAEDKELGYGTENKFIHNRLIRVKGAELPRMKLDERKSVPIKLVIPDGQELESWMKLKLESIGYTIDSNAATTLTFSTIYFGDAENRPGYKSGGLASKLSQSGSLWSLPGYILHPQTVILGVVDSVGRITGVQKALDGLFSEQPTDEPVMALLTRLDLDDGSGKLRAIQLLTETFSKNYPVDLVIRGNLGHAIFAMDL